MAQDVHIIDLRRSYVPIDPNAYPANLIATEGEDRPENRIPIIPYDGYNFMPTPQGYCSFFGINSALGIDALTANVDDIFIIQTPDFQNILVALAEDGIWTKDGGETGAWNHLVTLIEPDAGEHKNWSKCVIENAIYVYRQGEAFVWKADANNDFVFTAFVPTFLNMTGQLGIFKAGGRLGFWDSENSIAWSALENTSDFTASLETLAGNTIFQDIVGKIVNVLQHGTGFIIYCTRSVVQVIRQVNSPMLFGGRAIFNSNGIAYREEVCFGEPDTTHFAFTFEGLVEINADGQAQFTAPEISTYLKEKRNPIYLKILNGRYLFLPILDPYYLTGRISFTSETVEAAVFSWQRAALAIDQWNGQQGPCRALLAAMQNHDQIYLFNNFGYTAYTQAVNPNSVPIWEDHFSSVVPVATIEAWKDYDPIALFGSVDYFLDNAFTEGAILKLDGSGNEFFIPPGLQLVSAYVPNIHIEDNDKLFYHKQDFLWYAEDKFFDHWKRAIEEVVHDDVVLANSTTYMDSVPASSVIKNRYEFGPYLMPTFFSEDNRYYGIAEKSAWLQRSLTRGIIIEVEEIIEDSYNLLAGPLLWVVVDNNGPTFTPTLFANYASANAFDPASILPAQNPCLKADLTPGPPCFSGAFFGAFSKGEEGIPADASRRIVHSYCVSVTSQAEADSCGMVGGGKSFAIMPTENGVTPISFVGVTNLAAGQEVYKIQHINRQKFRVIGFKYVDFDTCLHKELGFTQITGHGHYELDGSFIQDDDIDEAPDYVDYCNSNPKKDKQAYFNGFPISQPWNNGATCGNVYTTTINGETYEYPAIPDIIIPSGTILLQAGSIEPIYPTYLGAFVYDIHYKKWGKMKQNFKQLLDYLPLNQVAGDKVIPYDTFNPKVAMLGEDGVIYLFDQYPSDSEIVYGKIGYYRKGFTDLEEVRINHRTPFSGVLSVEASLDGRNIEASLGISRAYDSTNQVTEGFSLSARWYNIRVFGNYDLTHLETRGHKTGKR